MSTTSNAYDHCLVCGHDRAELDRLQEENANLRAAGEEMVSWFRVNGGRGPIQIARIEAILANCSSKEPPCQPQD